MQKLQSKQNHMGSTFGLPLGLIFRRCAFFEFFDFKNFKVYDHINELVDILELFGLENF